MRILIILLSLNLIASPAVASCEEVLDSCNTAVEKCKDTVDAKNETIRLCNLMVTDAVGEVGRLNGVVADRNEQLDAWYRNPWIVGILGFAAGVVVIEVAK